MKITSTGIVTDADFKEIEWEGVDHGGSPVKIKLHDAINLGNMDWTMAEKNDIVQEVVFTGCYDNTDAIASDFTEPWEIETTETNSGAKEIILGAGKFKVGGTTVALTRGGGKFTSEKSFREINADGDRGPVKGRIVLDGARASLTLNALTFLTSMNTLNTAVNVSA